MHKQHDGRVLRVADMADEHLVNTGRFLLRRAPDLLHRRVKHLCEFADAMGMGDDVLLEEGLATMAILEGGTEREILKKLHPGIARELGRRKLWSRCLARG